MKRTILVIGTGFGFGCFLVACGGGGYEGGSRTRAILLHGEVEEGELATKAEAGKGFADYQICSSGKCTTTDDDGEFALPLSIPTGEVEVEFSITGPAFSTTKSVRVPAGVSDVDVEVVRDSGEGRIEIAETKFDGVVDESQGEEDFNDGD